MIRKNKKTWIAFAALSALALSAAGASAVADEQIQKPDGTTITRTDEEHPGYLNDEVMSIKPQVGALWFSDQPDSSTSRLAGGLTLDFNLTPKSAIYFGPSTGILAANLGQSGANFFGAGSSASTTSLLLLIPANAKLGVNIADRFRVAVHGGGNVIHRSDVSTVNFNGGTNVSENGGGWDVEPNVGGDIELGLGKSIGIFVRPDWTLTSGTDLFTGTAGLSFILG